jgi:hypothetical protein
MRAADAAEKISLKKPQLLAPFKAELLGLAEETAQAELRWHLALMVPRLPLSRAEHERAKLHPAAIPDRSEFDRENICASRLGQVSERRCVFTVGDDRFA